MRSLTILLACIVLAAFVPALAAEEPARTETAPLTWKQAALGDGETLYQELCAVCHGVEGRGDGPAAPALTAPMPDLTTLAAVHEGVFPTEAVQKAISGETRIVAHGTIDMPVWGRAFRDLRPDHKVARREAFSRLRIYALTSYIESLQEK